MRHCDDDEWMRRLSGKRVRVPCICRIAALAVGLALAGCSTATTGTLEDRVIAACAQERVRAQLPHLCADPVATARNIETAKRVLRVLIDLAL